jgi:3D (Asp-Asp-Asp) domain-containing protein
MKRALRLFILLLIHFVIATGCGRSRTDAAGENDKYVPLSEEQAKKLITPTIYFIPQYDPANNQCESADLRDMKEKTTKSTFASVCKSALEFCIMQGTCKVMVNSKYTLLHYSEYVAGDYFFTLVDEAVCPYGYGTKKVCVDPFYSVAADLSIYKAGTVLYVPAAIGVILPDGKMHDGFFIVRDSGGAIKGYGRFDFFTGFTPLDRSKNPLTKLGFAWKGTNTPFFVIEGSEADRILKLRNYPLLPE